MVAMRRLVIVGCALGCGRIHIEPLAIDDATTTDGSPSVCADEGAPCDDLDICTPTSSCSGGRCVGAPNNGCEVASSTTEFSTSQGSRGWYYGYWFLSNDPDATYQATDFLEFVFFTNDSWRPPDYQPSGPTFSWAYLHWWGGHPGSTPTQKLPVRRWLSDVSGHAEAVVHHAKADSSGGDGTRAVLVVDGVILLARDVAGTDGVGFDEVVPIDLKIGTTVDLMIHYIGGEAIDTTSSELIIRSR